MESLSKPRKETIKKRLGPTKRSKPLTFGQIALNISRNYIQKDEDQMKKPTSHTMLNFVRNQRLHQNRCTITPKFLWRMIFYTKFKKKMKNGIGQKS